MYAHTDPPNKIKRSTGNKIHASNIIGIKIIENVRQKNPMSKITLRTMNPTARIMILITRAERIFSNSIALEP
jgi:hypothetical protein